MQPIKLRTHAPRQTEEQASTLSYDKSRQQSSRDHDENPNAWTLAKPHTSAIRYVDRHGNEVIERGNKRFVIHDEPPPRQRHRPHWLVISGVSMIIVVLLWAVLSWLSSWWTNHQLDTTYEFPRISQADAVVYPGDSADHPSHYFFINLNGTISIIEYPHGDPTHARVYKGPTLFSDNADQVPVTGEFRVVNGKVEMLVHIQDKIILYINNGTQFIPQ